MFSQVVLFILGTINNKLKIYSTIDEAMVTGPLCPEVVSASITISKKAVARIFINPNANIVIIKGKQHFKLAFPKLNPDLAILVPQQSIKSVSLFKPFNLLRFFTL